VRDIGTGRTQSVREEKYVTVIRVGLCLLRKRKEEFLLFPTQAEYVHGNHPDQGRRGLPTTV
jgi:hypothetical protein